MKFNFGVFVRPLAVLLAQSLMISWSLAQAAAPVMNHLQPSGATVGTSVDVAVSGKLGTRPISAWCDRPEIQIEIPEKGDALKVTVPADAAPGVCWLRLTNAEGASQLRPFVLGTLPEMTEQEPNNDLEKAQVLEGPGRVINAAFAVNGDVDIFAVDLEAGQTLVASMTANEILASPLDGVLQIVSPAGYVLEQNHDEHGLDPQIVFTAPSAGKYSVRAFGFPETPNSSVRFAGGATYFYRLTVTTTPFVDYAFPLSWTVGREEPVEIIGWNIPDDLKQQSMTPAADAATVAVLNERFANVVNLPVVSLPSLVEATSAEVATDQELTVPCTVSGRIATSKETDRYHFSATKGDKLRISAESRSLNFPLDPVLRLSDANGKLLKELDDTSRNSIDVSLVYTIPADGNYGLEISDLYRHGGPRYVYRLTIDRVVPDYRLTLKTDRFTVEPGAKLEIPVAVGRLDGFAEAIEISIEGLPEGVVAPAVQSEAKGDSAKSVTLVVEAQPEAVFNGPIRIRGKAVGTDAPSHTATAPVDATTASTTHLWLTILAAKTPEKSEEK